MEHCNPFDNPQQQFLILQGQGFSLWPEHCALPPGWEVVSGPASPQACYEWLEKNGLNLTPASYATATLRAEQR